MGMDNYKTCTRCGEEFEATEEFFNIQKKGKFGLRADCKICCNKYYINNKEKIIAASKKHYIDNKESRAVTARKYYINNRKKIMAAGKKYRVNNREKVAIASKKYYIENKERIAAVTKKWQRANLGKRSASTAKWQKANPDKIAAKIAKRRATKLNQTPDLTQDEKYQMELIYKKSRELGAGWQVDHIIPLAKGGLHCPDNLQIVLKGYNLQKGSKLNFRLPNDDEIFNWGEETRFKEVT